MDRIHILCLLTLLALVTGAKAQLLQQEVDEELLERKAELMDYHTKRGNDARALDYLNQAIEYIEQTPAAGAKHISSFLPACEGNQLATNQADRLTRVLEQRPQPNDLTWLAVIGSAYHQTGQRGKCYSIAMRIDSLRNVMPLDEQEKHAGYLMPFYITTYRFDEAVKVGEMSTEAIRRLVGTDDDLYARQLLMLAWLHEMNGNIFRAREIYRQTRKVKGMSIEAFYEGLTGEMQTYQTVGDYYYPMVVCERMMEHTDDPEAQCNMLRIICFSMMGELDIRLLGNNDADEYSDTLCTRFLRRSEQYHSLTTAMYGAGHIDALAAMQMLSCAQLLAHDTVTALNTARECERLLRQEVHNNTLRDTYLEGLVSVYLLTKQYEKALTLITTNTEQEELQLGRVATNQELAEAYWGLGRQQEAQQACKAMAHELMEMNTTALSALTEEERAFSYRRVRDMLQSVSRYIAHEGQPEDFAGVVYDTELYAKGLLLGNARNFTRCITSTGDSTLIAQMHKMQHLYTQLQYNTQLNTGDRRALRDSVQRIENELLQRCHDERLMSMTHRTTWQEVQQKLRKGQAAIEIVVYRGHDNHSQYGAVTLRPDLPYPVFTHIGAKSRVDSLLHNTSVMDSGDILWGRLSTVLKGTDEVFFAPTGMFLVSPIEYMPYKNQSIDMSRIALHRVSSTRMLTQTTPDRPKSMAIYGGLRYAGAKPQAKGATSTQARGREKTLAYLPGTQAEADSIATIVGGTIKQISRYSGEDGTEQSFKALSGSNVGIIHIGTHGDYYQTKKVIDASTADGSDMAHGVALRRAEELAMTNSCLYMSGANTSKSKRRSTTDGNDGILTAQEIADIDLGHTSLVTLSACQTAQGDVSPDGVFGLQRGFKKAGAHSIMMSLWKVDDKATQLLMTEFYRHLVAGHTKQQALAKAQATLRRHDGGRYDAPRFWAAFILLDALD